MHALYQDTSCMTDESQPLLPLPCRTMANCKHGYKNTRISLTVLDPCTHFFQRELSRIHVIDTCEVVNTSRLIDIWGISAAEGQRNAQRGCTRLDLHSLECKKVSPHNKRQITELHLHPIIAHRPCQKSVHAIFCQSTSNSEFCNDEIKTTIRLCSGKERNQDMTSSLFRGLKAHSHQRPMNSSTNWANNLVWIPSQKPFFQFLNELGDKLQFVDKFSVNSPIGNNAMVQFVDEITNSSVNSSPVWMGHKDDAGDL